MEHGVRQVWEGKLSIECGGGPKSHTVEANPAFISHCQIMWAETKAMSNKSNEMTVFS